MIDDFRLWLKADAGTTGDPTVTAWDDQSGNGFTFSANGTPQLNSNSINFNKAIDFVPGSLEHFTANTPSILTASEHTVFAVITPDDATTQRAIVGSLSGFAGWAMYHDNAGVLMAEHTLSTFLYGGGSSFSNGVPAIGAVRYGAGGLDNISIVNGTEFIDNTAVNTPNHGFTPLQIGNDNLGTALPHFDGRIAEVIMYETELSDADIDKIESYLAIRYGITLDDASGGTAGDYLASDATILWDADANTTYHNDVAGVGRDDDSALDQQRSMSSNSDGVAVMEKGGSFSNDLDFILWGNDDGAVTLDPTGAHPDFDDILQRTWKVAVTGSPGNVTVRIVLANGGLVGNYALHVDSDNDFTAGATNYPATSIEGDTISFANVSLTNGQFFSMGSVQRGPGNVTDNLVLWLKANSGPSTTTDNTAVKRVARPKWYRQRRNDRICCEGANL